MNAIIDFEEELHMTLDDLKNHFGNSLRFQEKTGMSHANYVHWAKCGYIPILSQMKIQKLTGGTLKADFDHAEGSGHVIKK